MIVVVLREREGKSGGGKGFLLSDKSFTLSTSNFQTLFMTPIYPIDDGREVEKHQNGTGIGNDGDPAYTLDRQQAPAVVEVYPIDTRNALRDADKKDAQNRQGLGVGEAGAPSPTLTNVFTPAVAMAFDSYNQSLSDTSQTIRSGAAGNDHVGMVIAPTLSASNNPSRSPQSSEVTAQIDAMVRATSVVRRLTPMECERLQGFPDNWTEGQADSHRYKQMGNAVAVPVVQWIIDRITK